ncbi:hypothetical protein PY365_28300 [Roseiarcaceae bacterium H3SJ34-1]|uniref:hypothetical protein n=1 Tax=Terripilifer ovatus TaxID=3032367 RepID=UPI003AB9B3F0|nr:hypothetical protein [Roseiarcaceae bacterium H3SJ34-1]
MPLQNRVLPDGSIVAIPDRGLFTGNRGIIHDPATRTLLPRRWTTKAWIVCVCDFKGRRRAVMARRSWTELFFLDEATAFAAGHRPCFFCRREDARRFQAAWARGNRCDLPKVAVMDCVLHKERLDGRAKRLHPLPGLLAALPDGAMVEAQGRFYTVADGRTYGWTPSGYQSEIVPENARLLTPPSTVRALAAGYRPVLHPSLNAG